MLVILLVSLTGLVAGGSHTDFFTCTPGSSPSGVSLPRGDVYLAEQSEQTLLCSLNPEHDYYVEQGLRSTSLYFWTAGGLLESSVLNSTTIQATFRAARPGVTDVQCLARNVTQRGGVGREGGAAIPSVGICHQRIFSGFPPQNVGNFSCVSENWHSLNCTWEEPWNPVPTLYNLSFIEPGAYSHPHRCPSAQDDPDLEEILRERTCYLDLKTHPPYRQSVSTYSFYVNASNPLLPKGKVFSIPVDHYSIVRPGPAVKVVLSAVSENQLNLVFSVPSEMKEFAPGLKTSLRYKDEWTDIWRDVDTSSFPPHQDDFSIVLPSLRYAYTLYTAEIKFISGKADASKAWLWSDPVLVSQRTLAVPPKRSPGVNMGSFEVVAMGPTSRSVYVYWKLMKPREFNGPQFKYRVRLDSGKFQDVESNVSFARFDNISVIQLTAQISAENEAGLSPGNSTISIPPAESIAGLQPKSLTKIWKFRGRYEVAWRHPVRESEVVSYTLVWCRTRNQKDRPHQCDGEMDWKILQRAAEKVQTHDLLLPTEDVYQIAVAANTQSLSSGLLWSTCTVIEGRIDSRVTTVEVLHTTATTASIRWKLDCSEQAGIVYGYRIEYNTSSENFNLDVGPDHDKFEISNLTPYCNYTVGVRIQDREGFGEIGRTIPLLTLPDSPGSPPTNLEAVSTRADSAELVWSPPLIPNGEIGEYHLEFAYLDAKEKKSPLRRLVVNSTHSELRNLLSYSRYEVNVTACSVLEEGRSACSQHLAQIQFRTRVGKPAAPPPPTVLFHNATLVNVRWTKDFQMGAPEPLRWVLRIRRSGASWESTRTYSHNVSGSLDQVPVHLDHVNDVKGWSPDCENETNTNMFEFAVRVVVKDSADQEYEGDWSEWATAAAYCRPATAWLTIILVCVFVPILAVSLLLICCRGYQYWYKTKDFFGQVGKELDTKFVLASTDNVDSHSSQGPEFELSQFGGGHSKGKSGGKDEDDADTLLLDESSPEQKTHRQKSASESATSDMTSGCESQGGQSYNLSECSHRSSVPVPSDLASTCSGYVSMCRADSNGSASNYNQFGIQPARPNSTPYLLSPISIDTGQSELSATAAAAGVSPHQYSAGVSVRLNAAVNNVYLNRYPAPGFGARLSGSFQPDALDSMLEETSLSESNNNPGYSVISGPAVPGRSTNEASSEASLYYSPPSVPPEPGAGEQLASDQSAVGQHAALQQQINSHNLSGRRNLAGYISVQQAQELVLQPNPNCQQYCRVGPMVESSKQTETGSPGATPGNHISPSFV